MIRKNCEYCGSSNLTWREARFGHCKLSLPGIKLRNRTGYHASLARFPGDPQAYVDSDRELDKKVSQRRREGAELKPYDAVYSEMKEGASDTPAMTPNEIMETYYKYKNGYLPLPDDKTLNENIPDYNENNLEEGGSSAQG